MPRLPEDQDTLAGYIMTNFGFWDYSCPRHGSIERYSADDWDRLLDDMAAAGCTTFVLCPKWLTTGYRSRYSWLDQDPACSAVASDNAVLHHALRGMRSRGIRPWLLIVATIFPAREFQLTGGITYPWPGFFEPGELMFYDLDCPGLLDYMTLLVEEMVDLFGAETDGLILELEFSDGEAPHRIPVYDAWAQANDRPDFATIKQVRFEPRAYPFTHWRDFTTQRRIAVLKQLETVIRARGFAGPLASIIEIANEPTVVMGNVNLATYAAALPDWPAVTYDSIYDRRRNRLASMDLCIEQPRAAGLEVGYLTRGVMTFPVQRGMAPTTLEEQWRMTFEDVRRHRLETVWFMGSDARLNGAVCNAAALPGWGFADGRSARQRLLQMVREAGLG